MLFLNGTCLGILVAKDEVHLVGGTALVGPKHDGVGRIVLEVLGGKLGVCSEKLEIRTTAAKVVRTQLDLVLQCNTLGWINWFAQQTRNAIKLCLAGHLEYDDGWGAGVLMGAARGF